MLYISFELAAALEDAYKQVLNEAPLAQTYLVLIAVGIVFFMILGLYKDIKETATEFSAAFIPSWRAKLDEKDCRLREEITIDHSLGKYREDVILFSEKLNISDVCVMLDDKRAREILPDVVCELAFSTEYPVVVTVEEPGLIPTIKINSVFSPNSLELAMKTLCGLSLHTNCSM